MGSKGNEIATTTKASENFHNFQLRKIDPRKKYAWQSLCICIQFYKLSLRQMIQGRRTRKLVNRLIHVRTDPTSELENS